MRHLLVALGIAMAAGVHAQDLEREARDIEAALIAPCCFSQQVSVHQSPAADDVKKDIRKRLAAGESRAEILAAYRAQYGKRVLAEPPAEGVDRILKWVPTLGLVLTAALVVFVVRRFASRRGTAAPALAAAAGAADGADARYTSELDEQLRDLD